MNNFFLNLIQFNLAIDKFVIVEAVFNIIVQATAFGRVIFST